MTIEGLGKKFQEARLARGLTLDEAARMTKIRPSRLAEIEADDFSQFPSLAYAKGFLLIYGKFLDVDVTPYMEAFEGSDAGVNVDGYSYLQSEPVESTPVRAPVVRRRVERVRAPRMPRGDGQRTSLMPLLMVVGLVVIGFIAMRFILNLARIAPRASAPATAATSPAQTPAQTPAQAPVQASSRTAAQTPARTAAPVAAATAASATPAQMTVATANLNTPPVTQRPTAVASPTAVAAATPKTTPAAAAAEPEVRRAQPVRPEDLKAVTATTTTPPAKTAEPTGPNRVVIKPLKKTYIKVVIDDDEGKTPFERWVSPSDGAIEFRGGKFAVRVLDRDAVQIKKNGQTIEDEDADVTVQ